MHLLGAHILSLFWEHVPGIADKMLAGLCFSKFVMRCNIGYHSENEMCQSCRNRILVSSYITHVGLLVEEMQKRQI